jgi:hypothetical protein
MLVVSYDTPAFVYGKRPFPFYEKLLKETVKMPFP